MKILHVTNVAGVASSLVQGLRKRGIEADLLVRRPHSYGFPHETVLDIPWPLFWLRILKLSRDYDVAHIHSLAYWVSFNIHILALKTSRARLVIHLHGTELRESPNKPLTRAVLQICDQVLVSTPDLLSYYPKATWLPNPIDPIFKPLENRRRRGKALYLRKWYELNKEEMVREECDKMGLELTVPSKPIPYSEMPLFLNQFEVFFDQSTIPALSKTALEALACGCKVFSWKGPVTNPDKILKNHSLENVTEKLLHTYQKLIS